MDSQLYRIGKFLAHAGVCSRRDAATFLQTNRVLHNGRHIEDLNTRIPVQDTLEINGKNVRLKQTQIVLLHKPRGYVCTHKEQNDQKSIFRLLPAEMKRFFYAGRLDEDSRGLVLLSNDGDLIYRLTHPSTKTTKLYHVHISRPLSPDEILKIKRGIWSLGEKLQVDSIEPLEKKAFYEIHLHEGKNREIRRIFDALHLNVLDLFRLRIGDYNISGINEGDHKVIPL